jgi:hypothetical protein
VGLSINTSLERVAAMAGSDEEKYRLLLEASAIAMLRFDMSVDQHLDKPVSHNVRWLDFTHMLTFGNAARKLCAWVPALWPQVQLQMACFLGRNAPFLLPEPDGLNMRPRFSGASVVRSVITVFVSRSLPAIA